MLKVVYFGNSEGVFSNRHFAALLAAPCQIVAVVDTPPAKRVSTNTRPQSGDPSFVDVARRQNISIFEPASPNRPEFIQAVQRLQPDLFLAIGYTNILHTEILHVPRLLPVNFHPSLLPAYRGKHPLFWALRRGESAVGLTVHVIDAGIDTGDILYQVRVRTRQRDSVAELYDRVIARGLELLPRLIADAERGTLRPRPQPKTGASYFSSITADDFRVDWRRPAEEICRWINASPGQCSSKLAGQDIHFLDAAPERRRIPASAAAASPGTLVSLGRSRAIIAAGRGGVSLGRVHSDVQGSVSAAEWCRLHGFNAGDPLLAPTS